MTSHVPLGDPKCGGALFLLPREIRNEIYRLLVKGHYLDTALFWQFSGPGVDPRSDVRPDFAILHVSKIVGREATEILYAESVFRFIITCRSNYEKETHMLSPDLDRMERLAPMIQNVTLDDYSFEMPNEFYFANISIAVQNFGGLKIRRRSLLIRMLGCSEYDSKGTIFPYLFHHLMAFIGFRATTLEVLHARWLLYFPAFTSPSPDEAKNGRKIRKKVAGIVQAAVEVLEPVLGPAASGFKFDVGGGPVASWNLSRLGDTSLIGYLEFRPNKHLVESQVAKEDEVH